jgi:hypothetical protein
MPTIREWKDLIHSKTFTRDPESCGELLSQGIRAGPGSGVHDANEGGSEGKMANKRRSSEAVAGRGFFATLAAIHSYRAVYGDTFRGDPEPLLAALGKFWMGRFREGDPLPFGFFPTKDKKAANPGADTAPAPGPHEALEKDGR